MKQSQVEYIRNRMRSVISRKFPTRYDFPEVVKIDREMDRLRTKRNEIMEKEERKVLPKKIAAEKKMQNITDELVLGDSAKALKMLQDFEKEMK